MLYFSFHQVFSLSRGFLWFLTPFPLPTCIYERFMGLRNLSFFFSFESYVPQIDCIDTVKQIPVEHLRLSLSFCVTETSTSFHSPAVNL